MKCLFIENSPIIHLNLFENHLSRFALNILCTILNNSSIEILNLSFEISSVIDRT